LISVFQAALHRLPKAVAMMRVRDRVVVYANQRALDMFESSAGPHGFVGQPFTASVDAGGGDEFERVVAEQFERGEPQAVYEAERRRKSGEVVWVQATVTQVSDPTQGELWMAVVEDVTPFKRAAIALEAANRELADALTGSEQSFQRIVDSGMFGMFRGKLPPAPDAGVLQANQAFCQLLGWSEAEIQAGALRAPSTLFTPEGRGAALLLAESLRTRGFSPLSETELVRKDGSRVPVLIGAALSSELDFVAIVLDRSDYKQKEAALQASQARFNAISTAGVIGVAVGTREGVVDINEAAARMLGYSRAEFLERKLDFTQLTPPESAPAAQEAWRQLRERGFAEPYKRRLIHKSGVTVPVLIAAVQLPDGASLGLLIDLSEQERTESALKTTEEQLRQAQKMEAIGRLAGGVAHDFNNILSVILGYAEMIREEHGEDEAVRGDADEIHQAASRAANLTKQLLLFTRQQVPETSLVDLNQTLSGMHNMLERLLGEDIELETRACRLLGKVRADPAHLEQVVLNLVVNARDAMPAGGTLRLETCNAERPEQRGHVLLKVTDTGSGMSTATKARIFEPFFTTKDKDKGTGLGLSTVFGIVEQANGTIHVDSELGKGTTFTIALPCVEAEPEEVAAGEPERASKAGHETILLVEDEPEVRRIARKILEGGGYRVLEVKSPLEALEVFERERDIQLVLTDVVMPQMNGVELIRRLQEKGRAGAPLRVLCMSGYTDDETTRHGLKEQRVPFLQKPFTPNSLRQKVREVLDGPLTRGSGLMAAVRPAAKS
jgi:PAS domain S-box-containing protein